MATLPKDDDVTLDLTPLDAGDDDGALPLDAVDAGAATSEGLDADDEPVELVLEGAEPADAPDERSLVRHLREVTKAQAREIARMKAGSAAPVQEEVPPPGDEPTPESCGWDDDLYKRRMKEWLKAEADYEAAKAKAAEAQEAFKAKIEADLKRYQGGWANLPGIDGDEVEAVVASKLSVAHQLAVVRAAEKPNHVMAVLARYPAKLEEVAAINDPALLGAYVARLESAIKVNNMRKAPQPERRVAGGTASVSGGAADKRLEQLRAQAAKTGDFTAVAAYRRQIGK
jgi:hypothetical protein